MMWTLSDFKRVSTANTKGLQSYPITLAAKELAHFKVSNVEPRQHLINDLRAMFVQLDTINRKAQEQVISLEDIDVSSF